MKKFITAVVAVAFTNLLCAADPITGDWIFQEDGEAGVWVRVDDDGTWSSVSHEQARQAGKWERVGKSVFLYRKFIPDPYAELKLDIDAGSVVWTGGNNEYMTGKRPAASPAPVN